MNYQDPKEQFLSEVLLTEYHQHATTTTHPPGCWSPGISISVRWDRISSQTAHPFHLHCSCSLTDTDLLSLVIMKEICCNSYCGSDIDITFENKCRQFILVVVKWQWHWARWGMIKHSSFGPSNLVAWNVCRVILSVLFERWRERLFWMLWCYTGRNDMFMIVLAKHRNMVLNINVFSSAAGEADQNLPYAIILGWNGWESVLMQ